METIFIKRFINSQDDLPKKHGRYDTDEGSVEFDPNNKQHIDYWLLGMFWYIQPTTLAELIKEKLPSEEEIKQQGMILEGAGDRYYEGIHYSDDWIDGAKWIINKLTE